MSKILIVDDNAKNCLVLKDMLQMQKYSTAIAVNGQEALDYMSQNSVDLVLLDISMPIMDGHQVLSIMKDDPKLKQIPVIIVSANDGLDNIISCISKGAEDYVLKPFRPELLNARIKSSLSRKEMIDELNSSLDKIKTAESSRDAIIKMIIHDLKNPLTAIRLNAEMIGELGVKDPGVLKIGGKIICSVDDMNNQINGILDLSKLEAGVMPMNLSKVSAKDIFEEVLSGFKPQMEKANVSVETRFIEAEILADETLLRRILQNVLANAIKYAGKDCQIICALKENASGVVFTICDDGPGIPVQHRDAIFDKYSQIENNNSKGGVGLGLAFCRLAVEAQNGKIKISESPLGGAAFCIEFIKYN